MIFERNVSMAATALAFLAGWDTILPVTETTSPPQEAAYMP